MRVDVMVKTQLRAHRLPVQVEVLEFYRDGRLYDAVAAGFPEDMWPPFDEWNIGFDLELTIP